MTTYFISSEEKIISQKEILHYNFYEKQEQRAPGWLPDQKPVRILLTSGASCPDVLVEAVIRRLAAYHGATEKLESLTANFTG